MKILGRNMTCAVWLTVLAASLASASAGSAPLEDARYLADGSDWAVALFVPLTLGDTAPTDLRIMLPRSDARRFGQMRLGSPNGPRIALVVDETPAGVQFFVDRNRDRIIEPRERVDASPPGGREWRFAADAAQVEGHGFISHRRELVIRGEARRGKFSMAVLGHWRGKAQLGQRTVDFCRIDAYGNGVPTDPADQLWIDLNGDGAFDPFLERFPCVPALTLDGKRWAVKGDDWTGAARFDPLDGEGDIALADQWIRPGARLVYCKASLFTADGLALGLNAVQRDGRAPIGQYRFHTLLFGIAEGAGDAWHYRFGLHGKPWKTTTLARGGKLSLNPVGTLTLQLELAEGDSTNVEAGKTLLLQPLLFTEWGLLVTDCYLGSAMTDANIARRAFALVRLKGSDGKLLDQANSGFA